MFCVEDVKLLAVSLPKFGGRINAINTKQQKRTPLQPWLVSRYGSYSVYLPDSSTLTANSSVRSANHLPPILYSQPCAGNYGNYGNAFPQISSIEAIPEMRCRKEILKLGFQFSNHSQQKTTHDSKIALFQIQAGRLPGNRVRHYALRPCQWEAVQCPESVRKLSRLSWSPKTYKKRKPDIISACSSRNAIKRKLNVLVYDQIGVCH